MEGNGLRSIHLHLVHKQIVFVPLYFSLDHYLVWVPLLNSSGGWKLVGTLSETVDATEIFVALHFISS